MTSLDRRPDVRSRSTQSTASGGKAAAGVEVVSAHDPILSPEQVSTMLGGIPLLTLKRWRTERSGPVALHIGRHVRYRQSAVEEWLRQKDAEAAAWMGS